MSAAVPQAAECRAQLAEAAPSAPLEQKKQEHVLHGRPSPRDGAQRPGR